MCAVQGMPGVGKSYLCDQFYQTNRGSFPGGYIVLSLAPGSQATAESLLVELAARLRLDVAAHLQALAVTARLRQPRMLLHIENVDDEALAAAVVALTQQLVGCAVLVSARQQDVGLSSLLHWERVALSPLPRTRAWSSSQRFRPPEDSAGGRSFGGSSPSWARCRWRFTSSLAGWCAGSGWRACSKTSDANPDLQGRRPGERSRQLLAGAITASIRALEQALREDGDPGAHARACCARAGGFCTGPGGWRRR